MSDELRAAINLVSSAIRMMPGTLTATTMTEFYIDAVLPFFTAERERADKAEKEADLAERQLKATLEDLTKAATDAIGECGKWESKYANIRDEACKQAADKVAAELEAQRLQRLILMVCSRCGGAGKDSPSRCNNDMDHRWEPPCDSIPRLQSELSAERAKLSSTLSAARQEIANLRKQLQDTDESLTCETSDSQGLEAELTSARQEIESMKAQRSFSINLEAYNHMAGELASARQEIERLKAEGGKWGDAMKVSREVIEQLKAKEVTDRELCVQNAREQDAEIERLKAERNVWSERAEAAGANLVNWICRTIHNTDGYTYWYFTESEWETLKEMFNDASPLLDELERLRATRTDKSLVQEINSLRSTVSDQSKELFRLKECYDRDYTNWMRERDALRAEKRPSRSLLEVDRLREASWIESAARKIYGMSSSCWPSVEKMVEIMRDALQEAGEPNGPKPTL